MNKFTTAIAAAAAILTFASASAQAGPFNMQQSLKAPAGQDQIVHKTGKKGRFIAGLAVGMAAGAAFGHGSYGYYDGYSRRRARQCRRLRRWCYNGSMRACRKFDRRCW